MSKNRRNKRNRNKSVQPSTPSIQILSPFDINPQIDEIKRLESAKNKSLKVWLVFSTDREKRKSETFYSYESIIKYIKQNSFGKTQEAIKILERRKAEWETLIKKGIPNTRPISTQKAPTIKEYRIGHADDSNPLFQEQYISYEKNLLTGSLTDIYVGLDFGTSFTKIAYQKSKSDRGILHFGNSCFKPTVVYFNSITESFSFFEPQPTAGYQQIRFFKATMIKEQSEYNALRYKDLHVPDDFEFLCSVFFLSNIIRYCKNKLGHYFKCTPDLYITMGIPLFKNKTDEKVFNKTLHAAVSISERLSTIHDMNLKELKELTYDALKDFDNDFYDFRKDGFQNGTMPELFAESLYLLGRRDFASGYYFIVDIGGGTADFAFIHKDNAIKENSFWYYCPSRAVVPLGNEVRKAACIDKTLEEEYHDKFYKTYMPTIAKGKFGLDINGPFTITRLMFGGGAVDPDQPYQKKESSYRRDLRFIQCKVVNRDNENYRNDFISEPSKLSPADKQRLIIATQLANPDSRNSYLSGNPWDFDTTPKLQRRAPDPEGPGYDDIG